MMTTKDFIPDQQADESLVINLWPHPIVFLRVILGCLVLFILPILAAYLVDFVWPQALANPTLGAFVVSAGFAYYLYVLMFSLFIWMTNYLSVWTITTRRIISRRQNGLFNRTVSEIELYRVQDITSEQKGFWPTVLNYGDLYIQSAGEEERFIFKNIGNPTNISRIIQKLDEDAKQKFNHPAL